MPERLAGLSISSSSHTAGTGGLTRAGW